MPLNIEHSARIKSPSGYTRYARKQVSPGISIVLGIKRDGKSEAQAYRFAKSKFTAEQARAWLKSHNIKYISFEKAKEAIEAFDIVFQLPKTLCEQWFDAYDIAIRKCEEALACKIAWKVVNSVSDNRLKIMKACLEDSKK